MPVRTISQDELDGFQIDDSTGRLFWRGQAVILEQRFTLGTWELRIAAVAAASAVIASVFPIGVYFGWW